MNIKQSDIIKFLLFLFMFETDIIGQWFLISNDLFHVNDLDRY